MATCFLMNKAKLNGSVFSLIWGNGETRMRLSLESDRHSLCKILDIEGMKRMC